ncbi:SMI1/KNR4 family protein [Hymenobacter sp. ASUV-10]|uniref:SMI1/KNR4 family protein n=1 Tax=Hymenobacter aranciens TaxID=3063996 RepID=A0ABT9BB47_9BACT|nr:SMI1/KNR4 family protein [Hymenobacter sp. ASUV-10]MDO7875495.1 SMI1/KNR4 family protein [Hymenobacter sp. ASUV-10]
MTLPADFDAQHFWADSAYATEAHTEPAPSNELIARVEADLGYRLPAFYVALMRVRNGGIPVHTCFPTTEATSWADDHIAITSISGIGYEKLYSLCGGLGSQFMIDQWEYPAIGVVVADCPSAGHDLVMLDYRACGPQGEPAVVHVDQESDYKITWLAPDFETFVRGLMPEPGFE